MFLFMTSITPDPELDELIALSEISTAHNLIIEAWTVTIKEKMSTDQIQQKLAILKKEYPIEVMEDKNVIKYFIEPDYSVKNISVSFTVTIPKDKQYTTELVATIIGDNLNEVTLKEYQHILNKMENIYFTKRSKVFACLTTTKSVMITSDVFSRKLSEQLELRYVSTQSETIKETLHNETIYGYTALWNNEILLKDNPLNIQVVIQNTENQKQKIIIGTPILITEY